MSYRGSKQIRYGSFRGISQAVAAFELPDYLSPSAQDVDFEDEKLRTRRGATAYNSSAPSGTSSSPVRGVGAYYPRSGTRSILMAAGGKVFADRNQNGSFGDANDQLATGLSTTDPVDFWQFRNLLYFGTRTDGVYSWDGITAAAALVSALVAPAAALTATLENLQLEAFDSGTWTLSGLNITTSYVTDDRRQGTGALKMLCTTASAKGSFIYKAWSAAATVDLSQMAYVNVWVKASQPNQQVQIAVYDNTQSTLSSGPTWDRFETTTVPAANVWYQIRVKLGTIAPANRTASPGLAIRYLSDGGRGFSPQPYLYFDDGKGQSSMVPDKYHYYSTYAILDGNNVLKESAPGPVLDYELPSTVPYTGVALTLVSSGDATVTHQRIYRFRDTGDWVRPELVATVANATTTYTDRLNDAIIDLDPATTELNFYRDIPPKADTYALVGLRLFAGAVTIGGTYYANRVYISALNFVENFSPNESTLVSDPNSAGWVDLPRGEQIVRIHDADGIAMIFTTGAVYSIEGTGWGPLAAEQFYLRRRSTFGLRARWCVAQHGSIIFYLAPDGVRMLIVNKGYDGEYQTNIVSEPLSNLIGVNTQALTATGAFGIDERGRLHYSPTPIAGGLSFVFNAREPGALKSGTEPTRPGWHIYANWNWTVMHTLHNDGTDNGQLLAGDPTTGKLWYLQKDGSGADISSGVSWFWKGRAERVGIHELLRVVAVFITGYCGSSTCNVGLDVALNLGAALISGDVALLTSVIGTLFARKGALIRGQFLQLYLSNNNTPEVEIYEAGMDLNKRR